jgi:transcription elongation factor GreA
MVHLLDITYREIENRRDVSDNRRVNRQIQTYLFKEQELSKFVAAADEESISRIYTLVEDVGDLDPSLAIELRQQITERFPDFRFYGSAVAAESVSMGLYVMASSYEKRKKELQRIMEVEVPANSREIGTALEMGDLRENAEYKAAKEKQELLNTTVARLKEDMERAQIFDEKDVDASKVSYGTKVTLFNQDTGEQEEYTILGPWESNPSVNVISYLSPFGNTLWNHVKGDELDFIINNRRYRYTVNEIQPVDFAGLPA